MSLGTAVTAIAAHTIVQDIHVRANDKTLVCKLAAHRPEAVEGEWHQGVKGNFKEKLGVQDRAGKRLRSLHNASRTVFSLEAGRLSFLT